MCVDVKWRQNMPGAMAEHVANELFPTCHLRRGSNVSMISRTLGVVALVLLAGVAVQLRRRLQRARSGRKTTSGSLLHDVSPVNMQCPWRLGGWMGAGRIAGI